MISPIQHRSVPLVTSLFAATLVAAAPAAAQLPTAEQRAFDAVDRAIVAFNSAGGHAERVDAAEQVLDAAESARNTFIAADRDRDAADARYHAEYDASVARNQNCDWDDFCFILLMAQYATDSAADAAYADVLGAEQEADQARALSERYGRRGLGRLAQRQVVSDVEASDALHRRLTGRHATANRAALDALSRATRALSTAVERLSDRYTYFNTRAVEVLRAAADPQVSARTLAADPGSPENDRTDAAIEKLVVTAREAVVVFHTRRLR